MDTSGTNNHAMMMDPSSRRFGAGMSPPGQLVGSAFFGGSPHIGGGGPSSASQQPSIGHFGKGLADVSSSSGVETEVEE